MSDDPAKPPRFPCVAALLCVACVGAAVWTWMRYSYCWDVTAEYVSRRAAAIRVGRWPSRAYVRVRGSDSCRLAVLIPAPIGASSDDAPLGDDVYTFTCPGESNPDIAAVPGGSPTAYPYLNVRLPPVTNVRLPPVTGVAAGEAAQIAGRVFAEDLIGAGFDLPPDEQVGTFPGVDATRSRLTGASIAGLVVGAMGVFVFTVALRHWLGERRRFQEDTKGHNNGVEADQDA